MSELEDSCFPDLAIDGAAIRAGLAFPGLRIDLLAYLSALEVVDIRSTKLLQELSALWLREENSGASFTDFLQNRYDELEVADVECWQGETNMSEVTITVLQAFTAGLASSSFARDTLCTVSVYSFQEEGLGLTSRGSTAPLGTGRRFFSISYSKRSETSSTPWFTMSRVDLIS